VAAHEHACAYLYDFSSQPKTDQQRASMRLYLYLTIGIGVRCWRHHKNGMWAGHPQTQDHAFNDHYLVGIVGTDLRVMGADCRAEQQQADGSY